MKGCELKIVELQHLPKGAASQNVTGCTIAVSKVTQANGPGMGHLSLVITGTTNNFETAFKAILQNTQCYFLTSSQAQRLEESKLGGCLGGCLFLASQCNFLIGLFGVVL